MLSKILCLSALATVAMSDDAPYKPPQRSYKPAPSPSYQPAPKPTSYSPTPSYQQPKSSYRPAPAYKAEPSYKPAPTPAYKPAPTQSYKPEPSYSRPASYKPTASYQPNSYEEPKYEDHEAKYAYQYSVLDEYSNNNFAHSESREGYKTNGEYRVALPDGRTQIVTYTADENGYVADVKYDGEAQYPKYEPQQGYKAKPQGYQPAPSPSYKPAPAPY
ncbi:hypothetical protein TCAL_16370, partial [Tigriopus californicus]